MTWVVLYFDSATGRTANVDHSLDVAGDTAVDVSRVLQCRQYRDEEKGYQKAYLTYDASVEVLEAGIGPYTVLKRRPSDLLRPVFEKTYRDVEGEGKEQADG